MRNSNHLLLTASLCSPLSPQASRPQAVRGVGDVGDGTRHYRGAGRVRHIHQRRYHDDAGVVVESACTFISISICTSTSISVHSAYHDNESCMDGAIEPGANESSTWGPPLESAPGVSGVRTSLV